LDYTNDTLKTWSAKSHEKRLIGSKVRGVGTHTNTHMHMIILYAYSFLII